MGVDLDRSGQPRQARTYGSDAAGLDPDVDQGGADGGPPHDQGRQVTSPGPGGGPQTPQQPKIRSSGCPPR